MSTRPRHGKPFSGGKNLESIPQIVPPDDSDYRRGSSGPKQSLYDPNVHASNGASSMWKKKNNGHAESLRWERPPEHHDSLPQTKGSVMANLASTRGSHGGTAHEKRLQSPSQFDPPEQGKALFSTSNDGEDHSSESPLEDEPLGDEKSEGPEVEPEMLLQPETRPISHEQLIIEVKGIYAGLVMVEAKCIDIDKRQAAAAQEKDPAKKLELKDDQWQSLIALHKQVYCIVINHS
jgi:hypothetical protein